MFHTPLLLWISMGCSSVMLHSQLFYCEMHIVMLHSQLFYCEMHMLTMQSILTIICATFFLEKYSIIALKSLVLCNTLDSRYVTITMNITSFMPFLVLTKWCWQDSLNNTWRSINCVWLGYCIIKICYHLLLPCNWYLVPRVIVIGTVWRVLDMMWGT